MFFDAFWWSRLWFLTLEFFLTLVFLFDFGIFDFFLDLFFWVLNLPPARPDHFLYVLLSFLYTTHLIRGDGLVREIHLVKIYLFWLWNFFDFGIFWLFFFLSWHFFDFTLDIFGRLLKRSYLIAHLNIMKRFITSGQLLCVLSNIGCVQGHNIPFSPNLRSPSLL